MTTLETAIDVIRRAELIRHWSDPNDQAQSHEIYHDDLVLEFPQSGERIVGLAKIRAMREAYPAHVAFDIRRIRNSDDLWVMELVATYDGGSPYYGVAIMEFRHGKMMSETIYGGDLWEPPAWRAPWVEIMAPAAVASAGT